MKVSEIIKIAEKEFIPGKKNADIFTEQLKKNRELVEISFLNFSGDDWFVKSGHLYKKDDCFPNYDAVRIPGTNFVAGHGPRVDTFKEFIQSTALNPSCPIKQIVALVDCMAYEIHVHQDCFDYCLRERLIKSDDHAVSVKRISGKVHTTVSGHQTCPEEIVLSKIMIESRISDRAEVDVTIFTLNDNSYLKFFPETLYREESVKLKEKLWQLYQLSLKENIFVHCAAGVGRTGHFILTLEILKHCDEIFAYDDPAKSAEKIHQLLRNMRSVRPALVYTEEQFSKAIENAYYVYDHALRKGYDTRLVQDEQKVRVAQDSVLDNLFVQADKKEKISSVSVKQFGMFSHAVSSPPPSPAAEEKKSEDTFKNRKPKFRRCSIM